MEHFCTVAPPGREKQWRHPIGKTRWTALWKPALSNDDGYSHGKTMKFSQFLPSGGIRPIHLQRELRNPICPVTHSLFLTMLPLPLPSAWTTPETFLSLNPTASRTVTNAEINQSSTASSPGSMARLASSHGAIDACVMILWGRDDPGYRGRFARRDFWRIIAFFLSSFLLIFFFRDAAGWKSTKEKGGGGCTARGFCGRCQMPCDGRRVCGDWGEGSGEERFWRFFTSRSADGELMFVISMTGLRVPRLLGWWKGLILGGGGGEGAVGL